MNKKKRKNRKYVIHYDYTKYHSDQIYCQDKKEVLKALKKELKRTDRVVKESSIWILDYTSLTVLFDVPEMKMMLPRIISYQSFIEEMAKEL